MSQAYDRVFNFSAGPGVLPVEVLEQARDEMLNWKGAGLGVMEMSHRGKSYVEIAERAEADLRELLGVPEEYSMLFLQGGASFQFSMLAMNFGRGQTMDYVVTGAWGQKAREAAQFEGTVTTLWDGKGGNFSEAPDLDRLSLTPGAAFLHMTSNETIQGVDFGVDPTLDVPVICDMSSNIASRPLDVSRYAMIYAGAQKNLGPAGVTLVILRKDWVERSGEGLPPMLSYKVHDANGWMYNTPPTYSVYVCGLVARHWLDRGGLAAVEVQNREKAGLLYATLDGSGGFYKAHAQMGSRSLMNIPFTLPNEELTEQFLKEAKGLGFLELKGHRSVGGCRASLYNAMPLAGVEALTGFMKEFMAKNG